MVLPPLACPRCSTPLSPSDLGSGDFEDCHGCHTPTRTEVFPALLRPARRGALPEAIVTEGEAGCFFHPDRRVAGHCAGCGRFVCALCDVELNGRHLCPRCVESGQRAGTLAELEGRRILYDGVALILAAVPLAASVTVSPGAAHPADRADGHRCGALRLEEARQPGAALPVSRPARHRLGRPGDAGLGARHLRPGQPFLANHVPQRSGISETPGPGHPTHRLDPVVPGARSPPAGGFHRLPGNLQTIPLRRYPGHLSAADRFLPGAELDVWGPHRPLPGGVAPRRPSTVIPTALSCGG